MQLSVRENMTVVNKMYVLMMIGASKACNGRLLRNGPFFYRYDAGSLFLILSLSSR